MNIWHRERDGRKETKLKMKDEVGTDVEEKERLGRGYVITNESVF